MFRSILNAIQKDLMWMKCLVMILVTFNADFSIKLIFEQCRSMVMQNNHNEKTYSGGAKYGKFGVKNKEIL